jgi:hypothetical protein
LGVCPQRSKGNHPLAIHLGDCSQETPSTLSITTLVVAH